MQNLIEKHDSKPTAIDLFSGSGSVTSALKQAGYQVLAAVDLDLFAAATYQANHPDVSFFHDDICKLSPEVLRSVLTDKALSLLTICAPCQPFSSQNRKRTSQDSRSLLILHVIPFIKVLKPQTIWIENVPGLGTSIVIAKFKKMLTELGYKFEEPVRVDASDLGVPQRRIRFVFLASVDRDVCIEFNRITEHKLPKVTVRDALKGISPLQTGESDTLDHLHIARRHGEVTIKRLQAIPKNGGSRSSLPPELQLDCHKNIASTSFPDVYGRMCWEKPAPTLTSGCTDVTKGRFAHPDEDRAITLREAARLQTFEDCYKFVGSHKQIALQIGNAVPTKMAYVMFNHLSRISVPIS